MHLMVPAAFVGDRTRAERGIRTGNISRIFGFFAALDVTAATDGIEQQSSDRSSDGGSSSQETILVLDEELATEPAA